MAKKNKKFTVKKHKAVSRHRISRRRAIVDNQSKKQKVQQVPVQPQPQVVEIGYPQPSISETPVGNVVGMGSQQVAPGIPQPQPVMIQAQMQPSIGQQSVNLGTPQQAQTQGPSQTQTQDVKSGTILQEPVVPAVGISNAPFVTPKETTSAPPQYLEPQKKSKLWLVLIVLFVVVSITGGALYYFRTKAVEDVAKQDKESPESSPSSTESSVSLEPSQATEAANLKVDLSEYTIEVLNGSGISGEASRVKGLLEDEKFVVENIGNADDSNYEKTLIKVKKEVSKDFLDELKKTLEKTYIVDSTRELEDTEKTDVVIIVGSNKQP